MNSRDAILNEIESERERQDLKWGEQNHPDVDQTLMDRKGGCSEERMAEECEIPTAERAKFLCYRAAERGQLCFAKILVEEVSEAVGAATQGNEVELKKELVQAAAVCVAWLEAIERRRR